MQPRNLGLDRTLVMGAFVVEFALGVIVVLVAIAIIKLNTDGL